MHRVQDIVRNFPLTNQVFTWDALHCQKKTINLICARGNDYLIAVKKNQRGLYKCLEMEGATTSAVSTHITEEKSHGRHITRQVSVFKTPESVQVQWANSQRFIQVQRSVMRGEKYYKETGYYLSICQDSAEVFAEKIRGHWRIENQLHWVKDVIFEEDKSPLHQFQAVTNFSILSTIAMNIYRILGFLSVTEGRRWLDGRFWRLMILLE